jgi:uncharacterized metal-binding protein YceD (DUF177 family)
LKIEFRKITKTPKNFEINLDNSVKFLGNFYKISPKLVKCEGKIIGDIIVDCCRCGDEFKYHLDNKIDILVSDGEVNHHDLKHFDVIELDQFVDFDFIAWSEIESLKSDLIACDKCQNIQNIEYEF